MSKYVCEKCGKRLEGKARLCRGCYDAAVRERREQTALRNALAAKSRGAKRRLEHGLVGPKHWTAPAPISLPVLSILKSPLEGEKRQSAPALRVTARRPRYSESDSEPNAPERAEV